VSSAPRDSIVVCLSESSSSSLTIFDSRQCCVFTFPLRRVARDRDDRRTRGVYPRRSHRFSRVLEGGGDGGFARATSNNVGQHRRACRRKLILHLVVHDLSRDVCAYHHLHFAQVGYLAYAPSTVPATLFLVVQQ